MPDELTSEQALVSVVAEISELLDQRTGRVIVGVTGPPGVGKSSFAGRLAGEFTATQPHLAAYLPMDGFHLSNVQLDRLARRNRKGAPDTFDVAGYVALLERIADGPGEDVYVPDFDRDLDEPVAAGDVVPADSRLVITEGNYLALGIGAWGAVRSLIDRLYYLDCPASVRRRRLIERHVADRRHDQAVRWVDTVDEPNARLIAGTRDNCDRTLNISESTA